MDDFIRIAPIALNPVALFVGGWIYKAYIEKLKETHKLKDEQAKTASMQMEFWKDKATELEKKTPEYVERVLNERIKTREDEMKRLSSDRELYVEELKIKEQELIILKSELEKVKDVTKQLLYIEDYFDDESVEKTDFEIEQIGVVGVDSGQLMITDPCYIDDEWAKEEFEDIRLYKDAKTTKVYQYLKDFANYQDTMGEYGKNANELIANGDWIKIETQQDFNYSYKGACAATLSENGYGELRYKMGHVGAGIAIRTVMGDGEYPVYAQKYNGDVIRVYVNLL